ncbi:uncharacterized protein LOC143375725 [Andrena cerasifolii]|uniref:uncharacterized protein LOC143375725 n=1 Tax=Andrena cerasifolii TaxID=2819439 RepID=UPI0040376BAD
MFLRINYLENEGPAGTKEKGAMSSTGGNKGGTALKNKTPANQSARSTSQGDSANNATEYGVSDNKLPSHSARRSSAKPSASPPSHKKPSTNLASGPRQTDKLENMYTMKKKRYLILKKELMDKQKLVQDLYNDMSQLREKVISSGAKDPGKMEDLKLEIGAPKQSPTGEPNATGEKVEISVEPIVINTEFLDALANQLKEMPHKSQNLCREVLKKQSSFVSFVSSQLIKSSDEKDADDVNLEVTTQLEVHQKDCDALQVCLDEIESVEAKTIAELVENARTAMVEYESQLFRQKAVGALEAQRELQAQLNAVTEELQAERERSSQGKERLRQTEMQLQRARTKVQELESHVANDEGKIQQLQASVKNLENQVKQKDQMMDSRLKSMQKSMKSNEDLVAKVEKQRDSFESRLVELKEKINIKESEAVNTIKDLTEKLETLRDEIAVEKDRRQQTEEAFNELGERYKQLEEKSNQLCELAEKNKDFTITEGTHSENEVRLFNELQATRVELERHKDMMVQLKQDKEEIVAVMHQAASHEEDDDSKEKLAAELVYKNNELKNLMMQYTELKKIAKNGQERNGILENQLIEIQTQLHTQSKEGGKAGLSAQAIELQQHVSDLRDNLAAVIRHNKELETDLTKKQLELEERDRVMREQSKFLKVRDELLDILKGKARQENGELSTSDENSEYIEQITAKTEAIQELYATLEGKQLQIMRLEKMVKLMEDQQDRAQAQRTRLENRIAQLELALQRNKEQRGKGFSIL